MNVMSDNPISRAEQDVLHRRAGAVAFASDVLAMDISEGLVVGVLGPWGSGKTSYINLARPQFEDRAAAVIDFNPWMFSGSGLVEAFFVELSAQLRTRRGLADLGDDLATYGEVLSGFGWLPAIGPWVDRMRLVAGGTGKFLKARKGGMGKRRADIADSLSLLPQPIVVVLDDIDRLSTPEIRDIFRLVRLTASFPNLLYVLAFDRARVEQALTEDGTPGRSYLEKIMQVVIDLPAVPEELLTHEISRALDEAVEGIGCSVLFTEDLWPDVFFEIVRPLFRNVRDVRRFCMSIQGTLREVDGRVEAVDVLALEAVRIFMPEVFSRLGSAVPVLTGTGRGRFWGSSGQDPGQVTVDALLQDDERVDITRALIQRLFPAAQRYVGGSQYGPEWAATWLKSRRVANEAVLRLYLEGVQGDTMSAFLLAETAQPLMTDAVALQDLLTELSSNELTDVVEQLEAFEGDFHAEQVVPTSIVLLNAIPKLSPRRTGLFRLSADLIVTRVVLRLFRAVPDEGDRDSLAGQVFSGLESYSAKSLFVTIVGYREDAGHGLVSRECAEALESRWKAEAVAAAADDLEAEWDLVRVLYWATEGEDAADRAPYLMEPRVTLALLRSARSDTSSQSMGSRSVHVSPRLAWDSLVRIEGSEQVLLARIAEARPLLEATDQSLLEVVDRYASGWRPKPFRDE